MRIIGDAADPIYISLRAFLTTIGHLAPDLITDAQGNVHASSAKREARCVTVYVMENMARRDLMFGSDSSSSSSPSSSPRKDKFDNRFSLFIWSGFREKSGVIPFTDDAIGQRLMRYLVLVTGQPMGSHQPSLAWMDVWWDSHCCCGVAVVSFLPSDWEKHSLCESLFSAIGVRVVDILVRTRHALAESTAVRRSRYKWLSSSHHPRECSRSCSSRLRPSPFPFPQHEKPSHPSTGSILSTGRNTPAMSNAMPPLPPNVYALSEEAEEGDQATMGAKQRANGNKL